MLKENQGQISLEYLIIFAISLIIVVTFTMPLLQLSVENTLDISNTMKVKSDLSKLSNSISQVYSEGQGSKQTIFINNAEIRINVEKNSLSCDLKLNDGSFKKVKSNHNSNLGSSTLNLNKGQNIIIVEWPHGGEMVIYKK